jgi:hypothetical protein
MERAEGGREGVMRGEAKPGVSAGLNIDIFHGPSCPDKPSDEV